VAADGREGVSGYRTQSPDTCREVEEFLFAHWRSLEPWQKLRLVFDQSRAVEAISLGGIRHRHPDASDEELRLRLFALKYGRELSIAVWGWDPIEHGW
jgi:hypothetical protein